MLPSDVDEHRAQINGITTLAESDIATYAASIVSESPDRAAPQLRAATSAVVDRYGDLAAVSGALFYETNRPRPGFTVELQSGAISDQITSAMGWALAPLFAPEGFLLGPGETVTRLAAITQQFVAGADRATIREASRRDATSTGVVRQARTDACAFCALMSAQSVADDRWHNNCKCVDVPTWEDSPAPFSEATERHSAAFVGARQHILDARRQHPDYFSMKMRRFLRAHPEYAITNKNLTRVMRELYGYSH